MRFLLFGSIRDCLVPYGTRCKTGRTSGKVRATKWRRNFSQPMHPIHPIVPKTGVFERFLLFGFIRDRLLALRNSVQNGPDYCKKFVPRSRVGFFRNEHTRSTPCDPKLTFWCISYHLGTFSTVWLPYKTRCKTGRTSAKVRATKSHRNFSQRTHPILPIRA